MAKPDVVEVSLVFRGKDALENSEALMSYLASVDGMWNLLKGIQHFGGCITYVATDSEQKMLIIDGKISNNKDLGGEHDGQGY